MNTATSTNRSSLTDSLQTVLTAPVRLQTYLNVTYLALTGLLGQLYFAGFIMGSSLGVGLAITLLGFPILVGTLIAVTGVASIEARLADWLVDVTVSDPEFLAETSIQDGILLPGDGIIDTVGALVTARSTWLSIAVIPLKFVFSLFSLIVLPTMAAISAVLLDAPFIFERQPLGITTEITVGSYVVEPMVVETLPEALIVAAGGICFVVVAANLVNAVARLQALSIAALLNAGHCENPMIPDFHESG